MKKDSEKNVFWFFKKIPLIYSKTCIYYNIILIVIIIINYTNIF